jgi:hypothetical protein
MKPEKLAKLSPQDRQEYENSLKITKEPTISFKSLGTDATKPLNFNKRQSPRPLFNVVSHFSSGLMCFGWSNID